MEIPKFDTQKELFAFLVENKQKLIAHKKSETKFADGIRFAGIAGYTVAIKADNDTNELQVKAVINTTNLMDSHSDVHIPGLWNKSLKENRMIMFLQEHKMEFAKIIADEHDLQATTKTYTWKELGFDYEGKTEALIFDATVKAERNPFMLKQYRDGNVKNHSVGMQYVKLVLAINDEEYGAEFEAWEKYLPMVANKQRAEDQGFFWAVKEAKVIEGSAVPLGSNQATPTIDISEPSKGTPQVEPSDTQTEVLQFFKSLKY